MKKIFGYCLFGIFLLCIIHILFLKCGFYYRIMGPSVILNGLEDYYSEEFVITNSEVVKNKKFGADYVSAVDYYISPVSDETISFKVNYTGGTSVSSEHLAFVSDDELSVFNENYKNKKSLSLYSPDLNIVNRGDVYRIYRAGYEVYIHPVSSYSSDDVKRVEDFIAEYSSASDGEN